MSWHRSHRGAWPPGTPRIGPPRICLRRWLGGYIRGGLRNGAIPLARGAGLAELQILGQGSPSPLPLRTRCPWVPGRGAGFRPHITTNVATRVCNQLGSNLSLMISGLRKLSRGCGLRRSAKAGEPFGGRQAGGRRLSGVRSQIPPGSPGGRGRDLGRKLAKVSSCSGTSSVLLGNHGWST